MQELFCQVKELDLVGNDVYRVRLTPKGGDLPVFQAGQYLTLQVENGRWIPFSIGSAPENEDFIELHIRLMPGHELAEEIIERFKQTQQAHIQMPMGECVLRNNQRPIAFIVGGTGFSPIKAIIESAIAQNDKREKHLFWGAQTPSDFYLGDIAQQWQDENLVSYHPVVSGDDKNWTGATGLVHHNAIEFLTDPTDYDFYISGSEAMVMAVYHDLLEHGASKTTIYSDMLDIKRAMGEDV
ncbi:MAG: NAD(P)H-flavin reductase [Kangiellaceae bacterium]|nr:NAD(P)H-flavin reductase [Kangiellaceae bacterium]